LKIRASIARCIYGFNEAPIQASISIVSEDGSSQVATQTVNEVDGWLSLSANGFTYSAPTISVKLSQKDPEVVVATPTPAPTAVAAKKKVTITCRKVNQAKVVKKVTAITPKCPAGYRKSA
jgi:hypothetical protein